MLAARVDFGEHVMILGWHIHQVQTAMLQEVRNREESSSAWLYVVKPDCRSQEVRLSKIVLRVTIDLVGRLQRSGAAVPNKPLLSLFTTTE
jgi:hypothetical protein